MMNEVSFLAQYEFLIRFDFFCGVFVIMAVWEVLAPRRRLLMSKGVRWVSNLVIMIFNALLLRLVFPTATAGLALAGESNGWGLLNHFQLQDGVAVLIAVIALDLVIYMQHVLFHAVPVLWRFHMMHHADLDFDVTTGVRFHPVEMLFSMVIKVVTVVALGPPVIAVVIFEILLNASAMFNHANVRLPIELDRWLRLLVVTPDMHRVHHSRLAPEANSNFGFNLPWWDRLFGTYRSQPAGGHETMDIGLDQFKDPMQNTLPRMLIQPFFSAKSEYAINRRR